MYAASPGLHGVEHPIYDIWLTDCKVPDTTIVSAQPDPPKTGAAPPAQKRAAAEAGPAPAARSRNSSRRRNSRSLRRNDSRACFRRLAGKRAAGACARAYSPRPAMIWSALCAADRTVNPAICGKSASPAIALSSSVQ